MEQRFKNTYYKALRLNENDSTEYIKTVIKDGCDSAAIISLVLEYAIEMNRPEIFSDCLALSDSIPLLQDPEKFFSCDFKGRYWMAYWLLKKIRNPSTKIMTDLVHNMAFDFKKLDLDVSDIDSIQGCCAFVKDRKVDLLGYKNHFVEKMTKLREIRRRRTKYWMYYHILENVTCNPDHPIGRKRVFGLAERFNSYR